MQHVEVVEHFTAPPQVVFDRYTDHVSWQRWAGLGSVTLAREGVPPPNGVGCVRVISTAGIGVHEEVLSFEPPARMTYRLIKGPVPLRDHLGEVLFEAEGGGTRVTWRCRFNSSIPGMGAMMGWFIARMFRQVLVGLQRELSAAAPAREPARTTS